MFVRHRRTEDIFNEAAVEADQPRSQLQVVEKEYVGNATNDELCLQTPRLGLKQAKYQIILSFSEHEEYVSRMPPCTHWIGLLPGDIDNLASDTETRVPRTKLPFENYRRWSPSSFLHNHTANGVSMPSPDSDIFVKDNE
ncbi:hypothetical protein EYF80_032350 [Liparis tanakae]|uniref:Uncharacterized protein n=1 Tax=Liparis tanakae TaxID=230148 RepID=A0A4Z2GXQ4_9TELE|nr:hypothetical protein EYF80_032350 [Liparis tanakae]